MTTAQLDIERPRILFPEESTSTAPRPSTSTAAARLGAARAPRTLDQAIGRVWEDLTVRRTAAACLVCGGAMLPYGEEDGGACSHCGSSLS